MRITLLLALILTTTHWETDRQKENEATEEKVSTVDKNIVFTFRRGCIITPTTELGVLILLKSPNKIQLCEKSRRWDYDVIIMQIVFYCEKNAYATITFHFSCTGTDGASLCSNI